MNRNNLINFLSKLTDEQLDCSVCVRHSEDEFIDIASFKIVNNKLFCYAIDKHDDSPLSFGELLYFLSNVNNEKFSEIGIVWDDETSQKITGVLIDDGEFEDTIGYELHPYFQV